MRRFVIISGAVWKSQHARRCSRWQNVVIVVRVFRLASRSATLIGGATACGNQMLNVSRLLSMARQSVSMFVRAVSAAVKLSVRSRRYS